jgi:hypothetical protein
LGGTLCKIGSPLLSFLLCSLCTPLQTTPYVKDRFDYAVKNNSERQLKIEISNFVIQQNDIGRQFTNVCILE